MVDNNKCGVIIKQINDSIAKLSNNELREMGLTVSQIIALFEIEKCDGKQIALKDLEKKLMVAQSTTAGIINRLEQKKFVESFGDVQDKRIKNVKITALGIQTLRTAKKSMESGEKNFLRALTEEEQKTFYMLLKKVSDSLK